MPMIQVTPGYFETMGMKVSGALPSWSATEAGAAPVVVSPAFAKRFWRDMNPIGHTVKAFNDRMPAFPVVGIAEDVHALALHKPAVEAIYFPVVPPPGIDWK